MATGWKKFYEHKPTEEENEPEIIIPLDPVRPGRCPECDHGRFKIKMSKGSQMIRTCDPESGGCGYELEAID